MLSNYNIAGSKNYLRLLSNGGLIWIAVFTFLSLLISIVFADYIVLLIAGIILLGIIMMQLEIHVFQAFMSLVLLGGLIFPQDMKFYVIIYNSFFALLLIYYFAVAALSKRTEGSNNSYLNVAMLLLIFAIIAFISLFINGSYTGTSIAEVVRYFLLCPLFLMIFYIVASEKMLNKLIATIYFISIVTAIYSYMLVMQLGIRGFLIFGVTAFHGARSELGNANSLALSIGYTLPLLFAYVLFKKNARIKYHVYICLSGLFLIWLLCNSRSSYVYLFCATLFLIAFHRNRIKYFTAILVLLLGFVLLLNFMPLIQDFLRLESGLSLRDMLWKTSIRIIKEHFFWGAGPYSFEGLKFYYMGPSEARSIIGSSVGGNVHNLYLTKAAELGVFALLVLLLHFKIFF